MTSWQADLDRALANLRGSGGSGQSSVKYTPGSTVFNAPTYRPVDMTVGKIGDASILDIPTGSSGGNGKPWWMDVLNGMTGVGSVLIDPIARATDGDDKTQWYDHFVNIGKGQMEAWKDDKWTFGDLPLMGGLTYAGERAKGTEQLLENAGWKDKKGIGLHDVVSTLGDIVFDPSTYLTFGAGSAVKAGLKATTKAQKDVANEFIIKNMPKGGTGEVAEELGRIAAHKQFMPYRTNPLADQYLVKDRQNAFAQQIQDRILNAGKEAREKAQNNLINFDIPFTKITAGFGTKPDFMKIMDTKIGNIGGGKVRELLESKGISDVAKQADVIRDAYGVSNIEDMTSQMLEHLNESLRGVSRVKDEDFADIFGRAPGYVKDNPPVKGRSDIEDWIMQHSEGMFGFQVSKADLKQFSVKDMKNAMNNWSKSDYGATPVKLDSTAKSAPVQTSKLKMDNSKEVLAELGKSKFVQDMGGRSKLGKMLPGKMFNARSLNTGEEFVDSAAGSIRNAENRVRGGMAQVRTELKAIEKLTTKLGLSKKDLEAIPYIIEKKFPKGQTKEQFLQSKGITKQRELEQISNRFQAILERIKTQEQEQGALGEGLNNYFPHLFNKEGMNEVDLSSFLQDPDVQKWLGRSASNRFNQKRTSFDSFAQWQDVLEELENTKKGLTDQVEIDKIQEKIDELGNMLNTDPVDVLTKRYQSSVRRTAMKEMYNHFKDMGVLKSPSQVKNGNPGEKFTMVTPDLAKKLGIKEGSYIHKDVLEGVEKVESLFTVKNMNQFFDDLNSVTNIWKTLVTTLIPSHHVYNVIGNIANNSMAGVKISSYTQAGKLLKAAKNGTLTEKQQKIMQAAYDKGVISGGNMTDVNDPFVQAQNMNKSAFGQAEQKLQNAKPTQFMRTKLGDNPDDFTRLALFVHGLKQTGSSKHAGDMVKRYLFNYGELTTADRYVKIFAPFWNWTKNNVPLQLSEFARQPRYYQTYVNFQEMFDADRDDSQDPDFTADWLNVGGKFFNPRLPLQQLSQMDNPVQMLTGLASPVVKSPFELAVNKQTFNNQPIEYGKGSDEDYSPKALADYIGNQLGIVGRVGKMPFNDKSFVEDIGELLTGLRSYKFNQ